MYVAYAQTKAGKVNRAVEKKTIRPKDGSGDRSWKTKEGKAVADYSSNSPSSISSV